MTYPTTLLRALVQAPLAWDTSRWLRLAAILSFVAEGIHLTVAVPQYEIFFLYGAFFLVAAALQGATGVLLLFNPGVRVLRWTTRLNAFLIGSYVFTHTIGVLIGIGFMRLAVDLPGTLVTLLELVIVSAMVLVRYQAVGRSSDV